MGVSCSRPRTASSRVSPRRATGGLLLAVRVCGPGAAGTAPGSAYRKVLSLEPIATIYRPETDAPTGPINPSGCPAAETIRPARHGYVPLSPPCRPIHTFLSRATYPEDRGTAPGLARASLVPGPVARVPVPGDP